MTEQTSSTGKRPKGRSPLYPSINLELAIQRARRLYERERHHTTPVATIAGYWGYKSLNGPAAQTLAALKKYGLLEDEGTGEHRKARVSDLADVILVHPDEAERKAAIKKAALLPAINLEIWDKYHNDLPSDTNLHWELTRNRGFTETGASEFIPVYRATIAFAQLCSDADEQVRELDEQGVERHYSGDNEASEVARNPAQPGQASMVTTASATATNISSYPIPLIGGGVVVVQGDFPITEQDWTQFMAVLAAMKPGLVRDKPDTTSGDA